MFLTALRMGTYLRLKGPSSMPDTAREARGLLHIGPSLQPLPVSDKPPGNVVNLDLTLNLWGLFPVVNQMPVGMAGTLSRHEWNPLEEAGARTCTELLYSSSSKARCDVELCRCTVSLVGFPPPSRQPLTRGASAGRLLWRGAQEAPGGERGHEWG